MDEKILLRIDSLLKHIDQVLDETKGLTIEELERSNLLLRATCFSVAQIGETMNQLEESLGAKYFNLPWKAARKMRNVIVHDYGNADLEQIYSTIHADLPQLYIAFLAIKNDLLFNNLTTERMVLRKVKKEDAFPMFKNWASDPEVAKYVTWNAHQSVEETKAIINLWLEEEKNPKTIRYFITLKGSDEPYGAIDVVEYDNGNPVIGYCLSRKLWNKGYMTEACTAFIDYLFSIGFKKVFIEAMVDNIGSNRVIEKCGFTFTHKERREQCSQFKPEPIVVNCYEKVK